MADAPRPGARVLLSINRFERKKGLSLSLRCLAELRRDADAAAPLHLVLAGGFDPRLAENVEHLQELRDEAQALGVESAVAFVPSFSDQQKVALLAAATVVLYTPQVRCVRLRRALRRSHAARSTSTLASSRSRPWRRSARLLHATAAAPPRASWTA